VLDWTEKHAGLGGWVGAIGALLAIVVTWIVARLEYSRARRQERLRRRELINLITEIIDKYEAQIQDYMRMGMDTPEAAAFDRDHANDSEWHSMRDLAFMPVMHWPSVQAYAAFKRYWFASNEFKKIGHLVHANKKAIYNQWKARHDDAIEELKKSLAS
jgi:hypothetical protein